MFKEIYKNIENPNIKKRDLLIFFSVWLALIFIVISLKILENYLLNGTQIAEKIDIDVPNFFPFSVFVPSFRFGMILAIPIIFLVVRNLFLFKITFSKAISFSIFILIINNIGNGGVSRGYLETLTYGDVSYYQEALKIDDWITWLSDFNQNHSNMLIHSASHPPGPTLLMHLLPPQIATFLYLIISLTNLTVFYVCLTSLKIDQLKKNWLILFYAAIPSFNIYGILCADSMFLHFFNLFLLGICLFHNKKYKWFSFIYLPISLIIVGFLTFAVTFLFALGGIYSLILFKRGNKIFLVNYSMSIIIFALFYIGLYHLTGFNWLDAFFSASKSENPNGFALFDHPLNYFLTRLEGIFEFIIFAGIPFSIYLFKLGINNLSKISQVSLIAIFVSLLMLISGAFRTGETGRALMFVYPYLILFLKDANLKHIKWLFLFVLLQSLIMQTFGLWFW